MLNRASNVNNIALIAFIVTSLMLAACTTANAQSAVTPPGIGSQTDPYLISELGHLVWMGNTVGDSNGKYYSMTADIDASATAGWNDTGTDETVLEGFKPIGSYPYPDTATFRGIFDGNEFSINGLTINRPTTASVGLFRHVDINGQIRNLGMVGGSTTGHSVVGSIAGYNTGTVTDCYSSAAVTGYIFTGGLIGQNTGSLTNCHSSSTVTCPNSYFIYAFAGGLVGDNLAPGTLSNCYADGSVAGANGIVGGLTGANRGTVSDCHATGAVTGSYDVGGLIGYNSNGNDYGGVSNCYATGSVTATSTGESAVGGLIGDQAGAVSNCYATGAVTGAGDGAGGLFGYCDGSVLSSFATGAVKGKKYVGGLAGWKYIDTISNCYATGSVTGTVFVGGLTGMNRGILSNCFSTSNKVTGDQYVGGLVGQNNFVSQHICRVSNCYSTSEVVGTTSVGGLVGNNLGGTVLNSYWDTQTSGITTSAGGTGKTPAEMKQQATFVSWDFASIWGIAENLTYPYLPNLDADGDGVGNGSDACADTPPGTLVSLSGCPTAAADLDLDGDVDQADLDLFAACFTGPQIPLTPDCENRDLDSDSDVDQSDFGILQRCYSGENAPADPGCN